MTRYPLRRSRWTLPMLGVFGAARAQVELDESRLRIGMGVLGAATVPLERIAAVGTMRWPWWGGLGVRIARGLTAFVGSSGTAVVLDLTEPLRVRAPLPWRTQKIAVSVEDPDALIEAIVDLREGQVRRMGATG
ncbi:MAG: hypothetical protein RIB67_11850 [Miltoncostaeaceae bacterium]